MHFSYLNSMTPLQVENIHLVIAIRKYIYLQLSAVQETVFSMSSGLRDRGQSQDTIIVSYATLTFSSTDRNRT